MLGLIARQIPKAKVTEFFPCQKNSNLVLQGLDSPVLIFIPRHVVWLGVCLAPIFISFVLKAVSL